MEVRGGAVVRGLNRHYESELESVDEGERVRMTRDWDQALQRRRGRSGERATLGLGSSEADCEQDRGAWCAGRQRVRGREGKK